MPPVSPLTRQEFSYEYDGKRSYDGWIRTGTYVSTWLGTRRDTRPRREGRERVFRSNKRRARRGDSLCSEFERVTHTLIFSPRYWHASTPIFYINFELYEKLAARIVRGKWHARELCIFFSFLFYQNTKKNKKIWRNVRKCMSHAKRGNSCYDSSTMRQHFAHGFTPLSMHLRSLFN